MMKVKEPVKECIEVHKDESHFVTSNEKGLNQAEIYREIMEKRGIPECECVNIMIRTTLNISSVMREAEIVYYDGRATVKIQKMRDETKKIWWGDKEEKSIQRSAILRCIKQAYGDDWYMMKPNDHLQRLFEEKLRDGLVIRLKVFNALTEVGKEGTIAFPEFRDPNKRTQHEQAEEITLKFLKMMDNARDTKFINIPHE